MACTVSSPPPFEGADIQMDVPLSRHTSFRIGGPAKYLARPRTVQEMSGLIGQARAAGIGITILGGGTNTLVSDRGIPGLVILTTRLTQGPSVLEKSGDAVIIRAGAGVYLPALCRFALDNALSGLEWAAGIPGTLGGALTMNAGSFGSDMSCITRTIDVLAPGDMTHRKIDASDLAFTYRHLDLGSGIILGADLTLTPGQSRTLEERYDHNLKLKKTGQPVSSASAGCFFKNPSVEQSAGRLIDEAGLKGMNVGDARVSERHANFIINGGKATCRDILSLRDHIVKTVYEKFQITLEAEVHVIGE